jgi:YHS domain-containing protein
MCVVSNATNGMLGERMVLRVEQMARRVIARHEDECHAIGCGKRFIIGREIIACLVQAIDTTTKATNDPGNVYCFCSPACYTKFDKLVEQRMNNGELGLNLLAVIEGGNMGEF